MKSTWSCREHQAHELGGVRFLLARSRDESVFHVRTLVAEAGHNDAWFFVATNEDGRTGAFAAVEGTRANLLGDDDDAIDALAGALLKTQQLHASRAAHRHVIFGPSDVSDRFWRVFQAIDRQVVGDRQLALMEKGESGKGSKRLELTIAGRQDLTVATIFAAEHSLEHHGLDPRKVAPSALETELCQAMDEQRLIIGRESGRAMFMAFVYSVDTETVLLDRMHVPVAYRGRKLLVGGALFAASFSQPCAGKRVLVFVEGDLLRLGADRAGYTELQMYREIAMLG